MRELTFHVDTPFPHVPGQWVSVRLDNGMLPPAHVSTRDPWVARSYSVASAPRDDGSFDIAVTHVQGGPVSSVLHTLPIGVSLTVVEARGFFVLSPIERPIVLVATGTGVAPYRAMLQELFKVGRPTQPIALLFGGRHDDDLVYGDELRALADANKDAFHYLPTLSQASTSWEGRRGYVQAHLREALDEVAPRTGTGTRDCDVYVCGLSRMVKDVRSLCRDQHGVARDHVHVERYD